MTGLAGIGYGFLRLADPDRVPSVLSLMPPVKPSGVSHGDRRMDHVATARGGAADGPKRLRGGGPGDGGACTTACPWVWSRCAT